MTPVEKQPAYLKKRISPCGNSVEKCGLLASGHVLPMKDFFTEISRTILNPVEKPTSPTQVFSRFFHGVFTEVFTDTDVFFHGVFTEVFTDTDTFFQSGFHGGFHDPFCRCFWTSKFVFSRVFSWLFPCSRPASRHHVVARGPGGPRARGPGPGPQAKVHFPCAGIVAKCVSCESSIAAPLVSGNLMTTTMTACFAPVNRKHSSHKMNVSH